MTWATSSGTFPPCADCWKRSYPTSRPSRASRFSITSPRSVRKPCSSTPAGCTAQTARSLILLAIENITERKLAEEALRASEERLSLAIHGTGMGTWDMDLQTGQAIWSDTHFRILGYEPAPGGEATGEMWRERIHPDDREGVRRAIEEAKGNRTRYASEHRILRADDGETRWLSAFGRFVYAEDGEAQRFVGIFQDITERREAKALSYQATHDSLTGLVNRTELERRLARVLTGADTRDPHALLFLDLDQFKLVNDTCGHTAGDALLRQLPAVLEAALAQTRYLGAPRRR